MSLPLIPGSWAIDPSHSAVQFSVRHLGISLIRGRFGEFQAGVEVGDDLGSTSLTAEIGMGSISTGNADRDGHVLGSDFFNAESNPKMTFSSTSIGENADGSYAVTGDLEINGHSQSETLRVEFSGAEDNPFDGSSRAGFLAAGRIDRTAYGIDWNVPLTSGAVMLGKEVDIVIDAQFLAPSAE